MKTLDSKKSNREMSASLKESTNLEHQKSTKIDSGSNEHDNFSLEDFMVKYQIQYINALGEDILGINTKAAESRTAAYYAQFFNPEDFQNRIVPLIIDFINRKDSISTLSVFQQLKPLNKSEFNWYHLSCKLLKTDTPQDRSPLVCVATLIDDMDLSPKKVTQLLEEKAFVKKHFAKYETLTKREREIMQLIAMGYNSSQISEKLFISKDTISTHRKNIIQKLEIKGKNSVHELIKYVQAFDLF